MKKSIIKTITSNLFEGNNSRKRVSPMQASLVLALLLCLLMPQKGWAEIVTTTYDFTTKDWDKTVTYSTTSERNCTYFTKIGTVNNPERFAAQNPDKWVFERTDGSGNTNNTYGLCNNYGSGRRFLVSKLYAGDKVTFDVVGLNGSQTEVSIASESSGATKSESGNIFTMSEKGSLVVWIANLSSIKSIVVEHDNSASYAYDPAIEVYELNNSLIQNGASSLGETLDYNIAGGAARLIANPKNSSNENNVSYYALNNRIAVQSTDFQWGGGLSTNKNSNQYRILSINDLRANDRVVITYSGNPIQFGTHHTDLTVFAAANIVFKDSNNNGEFDEGETYPEVCDVVESGTAYTMEEDGHLDIRVPGGATITKIVIYSDHQARMVDRYGENATQGNTSYFDTTGQLEAKHHIVPGGLHVYVGNNNNTQHAEVQNSDEGPVSFVYDQGHYKMARQNGDGTNVYASAPVTGTFLMFEPDVSGTMTVNFKAYSIKYDNYWNGNGLSEGNEHQTNEKCPYYLMVKNANGSFTQIGNTSYYANNDNGKFENISVTPGNTYYVYGWWTNTEHFDWGSCGVAELIDVNFEADNYVYPLAKWVASGTTTDGNLATVKGYNTVRVKKMSSNIASCEPYIENNTLKIRNITFVDENKGGGTILIKIGDPNIDADPVFAYTIAYNAGYNPQTVGKDGDGNNVTRSEGHTWNFSENPLKALKWNNKNSEADVVDFGTYFNGFATAEKDDNGIPTNGVNQSSFLYEEYNKGDWTFNYRVKKNGSFMDPRFLNNWDMEGDNADMMWDTEGIIINAGSSQSCIFNEHGTTIDHTNKTQADPDRYVGFLEGGEFIIPQLKADDRVIVYMGSGAGSGNQAMEFHITNALDAVHNVIDPADTYHIGGSQWNVPNGHNDPYYRSCYHFYAKEDGDMKFTMSGGSMCKLYSIQIYRGERIHTNAVQEDGGGYTILAEKDQNGNITTSETKSWNLHYRGKGETLADGTGKFSQKNEVIAHSGNITNLAIDNPNNSTISYTNQGESGVLRVRVKCMEYNHNYVTDFADRNFTLALHETKSYPYTWDFTDIDGFSSDAVEGEYTNYNELKAGETGYGYEPLGRELSMWDENGGMILYGPSDGYTNQNMIFENSKGIYGNQLWANGNVIPETQGLWFYMDNNDAAYNGSMQITSDGLRLANTKRTVNGSNTMGWWNYKMVVPEVPAGAAIYLRMARDTSVGDDDYSQKQGEDPVYFLNTAFNFESDNKTYLSTSTPVKNGANYSFYEIENNGQGTGEWVLAIRNTKSAASKLIFTLNGWILKKLAISEDAKTVNKLGYASESRDKEIDPELMGYMTGTGLTAYTVDKVTYGDNEGDIPSIKLKAVPTTNVIGKAKHHDHNAYIIYNRDEAVNGTKAVSALNNGFHLFVPDMHDRTDGTDKLKPALDVSGNGLRAWLPEEPETEVMCQTYTYTTETDETDGSISITATGGAEGVEDYTTYVLSSKGTNTITGQTETDVERFRRVKAGVVAGNNKAYLPLLTANVKPSNGTNAKGMFAIVFVDEEEGTETTSLDGVESIERIYNDDSYYTLGGVKVQNPTRKGIYIKNGKKVVIK